MEHQHFLGRDGFLWFIGVVERRNDPLQLGRCRVRIFGHHTKDIDVLPSDDLPWALPSLPLSSDTPKPPKEGDWVWGFFMDGNAGQRPIMVGILPGVSGGPVEYKG